MKAKIISLYFIMLFPLLFSSCTKTSVKKNEKGVYSVCIDYGCANPKTTSNCEDAFATIQSDPNVGAIVSLQGHFPDNSAIEFILVWKGASGTFNFGYQENNTALYTPVFGQLQGYSTIDNGTSGTLTVTEFDQTNNRLTGNFSFKGKYFDGSGYQNQFLNVSGSFTNIPILDLTDPSSSPCR